MYISRLIHWRCFAYFPIFTCPATFLRVRYRRYFCVCLNAQADNERLEWEIKIRVNIFGVSRDECEIQRRHKEYVE